MSGVTAMILNVKPPGGKPGGSIDLSTFGGWTIGNYPSRASGATKSAIKSGLVGAGGWCLAHGLPYRWATAVIRVSRLGGR